MGEARSSLTSWTLRAAVAGLAVIALAQTGRDRPQSFAVSVPQPSRDRLFDTFDRPLRLAGMPVGAVRSVLKVREPLSYGQSIWNDAGVPPGAVSVRVDRATQILSVFRGGHEIATTVILYGAPEKPTPAGRYPVLGKKLLHVSASYGADMPYTLWLTRDGIAIHASDVRQGAATHGCIGVPRPFARRLFELVEPGVPVVIA